MTAMNEVLTFHSVEALQALSLGEVEALWELVPTERQRLYRTAYERTRRDEGASGSDALEETMLRQLLDRYSEKGLVPVGAYWVPTPQQLQDAARSDTDWSPVPLETPKGTKLSPVLLVVGAVCVLLMGFLLLRELSIGKPGTPAKGTLTTTPTATLARTYTPTPLALDAQDAIIQGGTGGSLTTTYPVNLRLTAPDAAQPRLFVVQRRIITTAEWNYDDNPDVASYLVGLTVHPVLGIPWSEANAELFRHAVPGTVIALQMNTGAVQRFITVEQRDIGRGDTTSFAQTRPGLTLVLLGQKADSDEVSPTDQRPILLAEYASAENDALIALPTFIPATLPPVPTTPQRIDVDIIRVTTQPGHLTLHLRIFNGQTQPLTLDARSVWLTYGYSERPTGPRIAAELSSATLAPFQAGDVVVVFAWSGEPFAMLNVLGTYQYALQLK